MHINLILNTTSNKQEHFPVIFQIHKSFGQLFIPLHTSKINLLVFSYHLKYYLQDIATIFKDCCFVHLIAIILLLPLGYIILNHNIPQLCTCVILCRMCQQTSTYLKNISEVQNYVTASCAQLQMCLHNCKNCLVALSCMPVCLSM